METPLERARAESLAGSKRTSLQSLDAQRTAVYEAYQQGRTGIESWGAATQARSSPNFIPDPHSAQDCPPSRDSSNPSPM